MNNVGRPALIYHSLTGIQPVVDFQSVHVSAHASLVLTMLYKHECILRRISL